MSYVMKYRASLVLLISTVGLSGALSLHAEAAVKAAAKSAPVVRPTASTSLCPLLNASYPRTVNDALVKLNLTDLTALADKGNTDAMVLLALRYTPAERSNDDADTQSRPQVDMDKAMALFQAAADKGHGYGEFYVGVAYMSGVGVAKDEAQAAQWFLRGAKHGAHAAQYWFGEMTAKGRGGLTVDWQAAKPYFASAAEGGAPDAYVELGYMYYKGLGGLERDAHKAAFCYRQGIKLHSQIAQVSLAGLINEGSVAWEPGDPELAAPDMAPQINLSK